LNHGLRAHAPFGARILKLGGVGGHNKLELGRLGARAHS
jgi:hypothetical protein